MANTVLGTQLKKALERSIEWAQVQRREADSITMAWARYVPGWRKMLVEYKRDKSKPNSFEEPDPGRSAHMHICFRTERPSVDDILEKLKTKLAREESKQQKAGISFPHEVSPLEFLQRGLDIEAAQ